LLFFDPTRRVLVTVRICGLKYAKCVQEVESALIGREGVSKFYTEGEDYESESVSGFLPG
jgi:hypothetical protein